MNIMVFDVPAENGGALSILEEFYNCVSNNANKNLNWYFVLSKPQYQDKDNIKVLRFPWVKKSWMHRLYFENFIAYKLVQEYNIDRIFSLQNITIKKAQVPQFLYVQQSLPFCECRFTLWGNKILWIYQNVIGREILRSIKKAQRVIVQTNWMKKACVDQTGVKECKVNVVQPYIELEHCNTYVPTEESVKTFFYPAGFSEYKNHKLIVEACEILKERGLQDYKVIFTLERSEKLKVLCGKIEAAQLNIAFVGRMTKAQVYNMYTKSILLFPSYIETFGLPMLECRLCNGVVAAADYAFSHEILDGYENAYFFDPFQASQLAELMQRSMNKELSYVNCAGKAKDSNSRVNSWNDVIDILLS